MTNKVKKLMEINSSINNPISKLETYIFINEIKNKKNVN